MLTQPCVVDERPGMALSGGTRVAELRTLALRGLPRMFDSQAGLFSFRLRRRGSAVVREGLSRRYTAIALLGLAGEAPEIARHILAGRSTQDVAGRLVREAGSQDSLGDLALIAWAAHLAGCATDSIWPQIAARRPGERPYPTVQVAWALTALVVGGRADTAALRDALAVRLREAMSPCGGLFPHYVGSAAVRGRSHIACFADLTYPVLALALYGESTGDSSAVAAAVAGATTMCRLQGHHGQWWWHYDYRTGRVVERYPVYAVHQDAMAPMALFATARAAGLSFDAAIARGMRWLWSAPELDGGSLVDRSTGIVWRKVARREPPKFSRYVQAGASRLWPALRAPGLDILFPPRATDYETRPYHLGWVLYAWPADRAAAWRQREVEG